MTGRSCGKTGIFPVFLDNCEGVSDPTSAARNYKKTAKCVHPYGITGIEITDMQFTLVKWKMTTRSDLSLYVAREVRMGPVSIT